MARMYTFHIALDGTLCTDGYKESGVHPNFPESTPCEPAIQFVRDRMKEGHRVVILTSSFRDDGWHGFTRWQLKQWQCPSTHIAIGGHIPKEYDGIVDCDILIDDESVGDWDKLANPKRISMAEAIAFAKNLADIAQGYSITPT